ncbi:MAG: HDOD domain-containing protein, partial [Proteobacteria bacterium]|nr:HDOD domain-containing protein [Pseudomonadota bacterium]
LLEGPHPPFLMLTPPDDIRTIVDIVEIGIGYIPKVPEYQKLLGLTANNTLAQLKENEQLKQNVLSLKQRVEELEKAQSEQRESTKGNSFPKTRLLDEKTNILDEIIVVFKRGEIELPTLPLMSIKFQEMMNIGANLQVIGAFLKQDMAISSKLISVSNSAYYRGVNESKNLGQAVGRLGLKNTKRYVDAVCNRSLYVTKNKRFLTLLESLWEHSLACAYVSQILDESLALSLENDAFTMGLLHDIGKLLLLQVIGQLQLKKKIGDQLEVSEILNTINLHHGKFGAALLKKWNFSEGFSRIAAYHDDLEKADTVSNDLLVVHFGNLMAKSMGFTLEDTGSARPPEIDLEDTESARRLGLDDSMIDEFKHKVSGFMSELKGLLA